MLASLDTLAQFGNTLRRQGFLPATVGPALLGERDALALPLADQGAFELGERAHYRQHQVRHRRVLAGEGQMLLKELDAYAALGEALHQAAQVVEVARQTIHAVHHDRVAFAHEGEQPFQFGPPCVLARRLVGEHFIHLDLFELPFWVLVEAADADVTDALTVQGILLREMCQEEIYDP
ncbi:Uncharacterised protein [Klebsiella pneumoniae]|nr:Uncharacterised protein [Klebsiella pneumoniae]SLY25622.1 Uncharacterised protein [Klebsiella pneumoniae]SLY25637.1 Uncharacterised protein [Klebsiella pneumoniae]SMB58838.1 Uncharacterised protein [Klebsiella pneumoniae]